MQDELQSLTPGDAWETFVGGQSVADFLAESARQGHTTPEAAVAVYIAEYRTGEGFHDAEPPYAADDDASWARVESLLLAHATRPGAVPE